MLMAQDTVRSHPVVDTLDGVCEALAATGEAAFYGLSRDELETAIHACERAKAFVFTTMLGLVAEAHGRGLARDLGATSTAAWLRDRYRIRPGDAKRLVELATAVQADDRPVDYAANVGTSHSGRAMPATAAALADGAISPEHVAVVGKVMRNLPDRISVEQARQAEADLAGFCREHDPHTVAKLGDYLLGILEADTLDDGEHDRHRTRTLSFNDHTGRLTGQLTREAMATLRTALEPLAAPNPADDGTPDERTAGQRLADALVELARRALTSDSLPTNHGLSHRVMVHIGLDALTNDHTCTPPDATSNPSSDPDTQPSDHPDSPHGSGGSGGNGGGGSGGSGNGGGGHHSKAHGDCPISAAHHTSKYSPPASSVAPGEINWGGAITPAAARRIACDAGIQRIILDPMGAVLDVGREHRTVTPAQFTALIARDGGCTFPGCTRPPAWCQAHHIVHWIDGGPSDLDNYALLCGHHHRLVHGDRWKIQMATDRHPEFIPPPWIDPNRQPRRNNRPRHHHTRTRAP